MAKRWFSIPNPILLSRPYRGWGSAFLTNSYLMKGAVEYYVKQRKRTVYERLIKGDSVLLKSYYAPPSIPYYDPKLMAHLKKYLKFQDFRVRYDVYLRGRWNHIYAELDFSAGEIVTIEQEIYQRDRLMQIFKSCPTGSYGWYAYYGLGPVKFLVQSYAAAEIDKFFGSFAHIIAEPFGRSIDNLMTALETMYWNSRTEWIDYAAGQVIGQPGRSLGVRLGAKAKGYVEDQSKPGTLTEGEWSDVRSTIIDVMDSIDKDVSLATKNEQIIARIRKILGDIYDQAEKEGRLREKPESD